MRCINAHRGAYATRAAEHPHRGDAFGDPASHPIVVSRGFETQEVILRDRTVVSLPLANDMDTTAFGLLIDLVVQARHASLAEHPKASGVAEAALFEVIPNTPLKSETIPGFARFEVGMT
jgi:hypothetical protein